MPRPKAKPNTHCCQCGKETYKKPWILLAQKPVYCSTHCYNLTKIKPEQHIQCSYCGLGFSTRNAKRKFCSQSCANKSRAGTVYKKRITVSTSYLKLQLLQQTFGFSNCMIEGCEYNKVYDIHRLVKGEDGGLYVIGNMFAICPNHHAEIHRGIIEVEKISDCCLRIC